MASIFYFEYPHCVGWIRWTSVRLRGGPANVALPLVAGFFIRRRVPGLLRHMGGGLVLIRLIFLLSAYRNFLGDEGTGLASPGAQGADPSKTRAATLQQWGHDQPCRSQESDCGLGQSPLQQHIASSCITEIGSNGDPKSSILVVLELLALGAGKSSLLFDMWKWKAATLLSAASTAACSLSQEAPTEISATWKGLVANTSVADTSEQSTWWQGRRKGQDVSPATAAAVSARGSPEASGSEEGTGQSEGRGTAGEAHHRGRDPVVWTSRGSGCQQGSFARFSENDFGGPRGYHCSFSSESHAQVYIFAGGKCKATQDVATTEGAVLDGVGHVHLGSGFQSGEAARGEEAGFGRVCSNRGCAAGSYRHGKRPDAADGWWGCQPSSHEQHDGDRRATNSGASSTARWSEEGLTRGGGEERGESWRLDQRTQGGQQQGLGRGQARSYPQTKKGISGHLVGRAGFIMCQWWSLRGIHWLQLSGAGLAHSVVTEENFVSGWMATQLAAHRKYTVQADLAACRLTEMDPRIQKSTRSKAVYQSELCLSCDPSGSCALDHEVWGTREMSILETSRAEVRGLDDSEEDRLYETKLRSCLRPALCRTCKSVSFADGDALVQYLPVGCAQRASRSDRQWGFAFQEAAGRAVGSPSPSTPPSRPRVGAAGRSPGQIAILRAEAVRVAPDELRAVPIFYAPAHTFSWGGAGREATNAFTVFDTCRHVTIERALPAASLVDMVALALSSAPYNVLSVQILADPVPGMPLPQLVLHEAHRPAIEMSIVWDLRPLDEGIFTLRHESRQNRADALTAAETALRQPRHLQAEVDAGTLVVSDALGVLQPQLPANLHVVQHLRVAVRPQLSSDISAPLLQQQEAATTDTTTMTRVVPAVPMRPGLRLVVLRGSVLHSVDVEATATGLDAIIWQLIESHFQHEQWPETLCLVLAGAQPPRQGYMQEVIFVLQEAGNEVTMVWDARHNGHAIAACSRPALQQTTLLLGEEWRDQWRMAVNGAPEHLMQRTARFGDFVQPYHGTQVPPTTPLSWVFELCPALQPFAWSLDTGCARNTFFRAARLRRQQLGFHLLDVGVINIVGPLHGDLRLRTGIHAIPSAQQVNTAISRLADLPPGLRFVDTPVDRDMSVSLVSDAPNSPFHTILAPAPGFTGHFIALLVSSSAESLVHVPAEPGVTLQAQRSLAPGDVLLPIRDRRRVREPNLADIQAEEDASTFLQLQKPKVEVGIAVATPFGRRRVSVPPAQPRAKQIISLDSAIPASQGPSTELRLGTSGEILEAIYRDFTVDNLCRVRPHRQQLPAHVASCLDALPDATGRDVSAIQLYVDGSFYPATSELGAKAGWAICVLTCEHGVWHFAGYVAVAAPTAGSSSTLGLPVESSFEPELAAIAYAQAFCVGFNAPALIVFDNQAAAQIGFAEATPARRNVIADVCTAQVHLLRKLGREPMKIHVKSHSRHPLNDLVDVLAKGAASQDSPRGLSNALYEASQEGVLEWLWAANNLHPCLPYIREDGILFDRHASQSGQPLDACIALNPQETAQPIAFDLTAVTYNCLSLQALHHREHLDKQFSQLKCSIVGLQETRTNPSPRCDSQNFFVLSSSAEAGQLGVQLWLAKRVPVARAAKGPVFWEGDSMSIISAKPRVLIATARAASQTFGFIVAHAPTGKTPTAIRRQWWQDLASALRRLPPRCIPLLLIDANAQFQWHPEPPSADRALDHNAQDFAALTREHGMIVSPNISSRGEKLITWQGPAQLECCLDYIACASCLGPAIQHVDAFPAFEGLSDHDHFPLCVRFKWVAEARIPPKVLRVDRQAMRTPEGKRIIKQIFDAAPAIPWSCDVDTHLGMINAHLSSALQKAFPQAAAKPRNYVIQEQTWLHIRSRRDLKRHLYRDKQESKRAVLSHFFSVWRGCNCTPVPIKLFRLHEALVVRQLRDLSRLVKSCTRADRAKAAKAAMQAARDRGPEAKYSLIRGILRCGRRYRAPVLQPSITDSKGTIVEDSHKELGLHFAKAERASLVSGSQLLPVPLRPLREPLLAHADVGVSALARGFSLLQPNKATGPTGLPAEAYLADPIGAASLHEPLVMKVQLRGVMPGLWRGGHATPIPKPEKPLQSLDGWRSILLTESSVKGLQKALREPLLRCMKAVKTRAQGGSLPGGPLQVPMAWAQGHLQKLHDDQVTGGILYIDGKSAFYSTVRESLMGHESGHSLDLINQLAEAVFEDATDRMAFVAAALGPSLLEQHEVPESLRRVIAASLKDTWYTVGRDQRHVFSTVTGTCPGSPIADVAFQVLFAEAISRVEQILLELAQDAPGSSRDAITPAPSWMDDLAVPLRTADGDALMAATARILRSVYVGMRRMGLDINLSRGKTELMPIFYGKGSRKAKQRWLIEEGAKLAVDLDPNRTVQVGMTGHYVHLGARLDVTGRDLQAVKYRAGLMREMIKPLRRLLRSPDLSEGEKIDMIRSMPHARLRHGAGCWRLATEREYSCYQAAYYEAPRRLFRLVTALATQGVTDNDVALVLGLPRALEMWHADVLRQLGWILQADQPCLQKLWLDSAWGQLARKATQQIVCTLGMSFDDAWLHLFSTPSAANRWARRYLRACIAARADSRVRRRKELEAMQEAREAGVVFCKFKTEGPRPEEGFSCALCREVFLTKAARAAHCSKAHQQLAPSTRLAAGTSCAVCMKEFWTRDRLKLHLRKSSVCLSVAEGADLPGDCPVTNPDSSCRWLPATRLVGPQPWWAGLRPRASESPARETTEAWRPHFNRYQQCICSDLSRLPQVIKEIVEHRAFAAVCEDDLPLSVAALSCQHRDLLRLLLQVCQFSPAQSAASYLSGAWSALLYGERVVIRPTALTSWAQLRCRLPTEWVLPE